MLALLPRQARSWRVAKLLRVFPFPPASSSVFVSFVLARLACCYRRGRIGSLMLRHGMNGATFQWLAAPVLQIRLLTLPARYSAQGSSRHREKSALYQGRYPFYTEIISFLFFWGGVLSPGSCGSIQSEHCRPCPIGSFQTLLPSGLLSFLQLFKVRVLL